MCDEPMPKPGKEDVIPVARALFLEVQEMQIAKGLATYGTTLQTHNGRNPFMDAITEQVDNLHYTVQAMMEYDDLLAETERLRAALTITEAKVAAAARADVLEYADSEEVFDQMSPSMWEDIKRVARVRLLAAGMEVPNG